MNVKSKAGLTIQEKRGRLFKRLSLALCCVLLILCAAGCGQGDAQSTVSIGIDGYTYVPQYRELPTSQDSYIGNYVLSAEGDELYYLQTNYGMAGISNQLYRVSLTEEGEPTPIPVKLPDNGNASQMLMDQDGNFIFVFRGNSEVSEYTTVNFSLIKYDADGNLISTVDVTEQMSDGQDAAYAYIQYVSIDGEGNYYVSTGETVYLYQASGQYHGKLDFANFTNSMCTGKDGKVYILSYGTTNMELTAIDFAGKKLGNTYQNIPNLNGGNMSTGLGGDFLINNGTGLAEYDLTTQTASQILNWVDSDISGNSMLMYGALPDGRILVINSNWDGEGNSTEIALLTKTPVSELPEKEIIQAGTLYESYALREAAIKFNKRSDKYRITIKSYIDSNATMTDTTYSDAIATMNNEITSNNPPDILLMTTGMVDMSAYAAKGALVDLFDYLDKDEELKQEDLMDGVVKAFTFEDKLVGLPGTFSIQTIVGKSSVVGDQPGMTLDKLKTIMDQYPDTPAFPYASKFQMLNILLAFSLDSFIDWDKAKCQFNDEEFIKILELCNRFPAETNYDASYEGMGGGLSEGTVLMEDAYIYDITAYQLYHARVNEPITFVGYPTPDGTAGGAIEASSGVYTISGKSKHKDAAWEFIKFTIREGNEYSGDFSVLKSEMEELFIEAMTPNYQMDMDGQPMLDENGEKIEMSKGGYGFGDSEVIELYAATQEEIDGFRELLNSSGVNYGGSQEILAIIIEEVQAYFDAQKSVEEVADIIQSRVQIYVSENS
jgi:ABC-type glycerol-3-phosphate transport system substrate-binding protein